MVKEPRIGIVGLGRAGGRRLRTVLADCPRRLAWVADLDRTRTPDLPSDLPRFTCLAEALAAESPSVLFVCTPPASHQRLFLEAAQAGVRHLLVEKPLACTAAAARQMVAEAAGRGIHLKVGSNTRCFPELRHLIRLVQEGAVGAVADASVEIGHDGSSLPEWGKKAAQAGGGALLDNGVHAIDLALRLGLLTGPAQVTADISFLAPAIDDEARWELTRPRCRCRFRASWRRRDGNYLTVELAGSKATARAVIGTDSGVELTPVRGEPQRWAFSAPADSWGDDTRHFLACAAAGQQAGASGSDALLALNIVEAAYRAARQGGSIDCPISR